MCYSIEYNILQNNPDHQTIQETDTERSVVIVNGKMVKFERWLFHSDLEICTLRSSKMRLDIQTEDGYCIFTEFQQVPIHLLRLGSSNMQIGFTNVWYVEAGSDVNRHINTFIIIHPTRSS